MNASRPLWIDARAGIVDMGDRDSGTSQVSGGIVGNGGTGLYKSADVAATQATN